MAEPQQPFEYTGGAGCGPAGAMPAGSHFEADNVVDPRQDIAAPLMNYNDKALKMFNDGQE